MENNTQDITEATTPAQATSQPAKQSKKGVLLAGALGLGLIGGFSGSLLQEYLSDDAKSQDTVLETAKDDGNSVVTPNEESIAAVANKVSPSVVSILTSSQRASLYNQTVEQAGAGTGMIVSSNGYILTNKHVVAGADTVSVVLPDGETYNDVEVLGTDPLNDVAFLKINGVSGLPAVTLGDSKTIRIGQTVVAIGNALGQYQNSVTSGIVSGTGRPVVASSDGTANGKTESLTDLIQTDAAINSGNSGGPILNLKGQVIGINTAIAEDAQGIGFAIPIGATKGMLNHVIKTGKIARAYLGVQYVSITSETRERYKLSVDKGDYVIGDARTPSVQKGGPADKAGVKDRDIIVAVNDNRVGVVASVASLVSEYQPGDEVELTVLRGGRTLTLHAVLGTYRG